MMSSGGTTSSNATGWVQGRHESDDCEPLNDTPLYAYSNTYTNLTLQQEQTEDDVIAAADLACVDLSRVLHSTCRLCGSYIFDPE